MVIFNNEQIKANYFIIKSTNSFSSFRHLSLESNPVSVMHVHLKVDLVAVPAKLINTLVLGIFIAL